LHNAFVLGGSVRERTLIESCAGKRDDFGWFKYRGLRHDAGADPCLIEQADTLVSDRLGEAFREDSRLLGQPGQEIRDGHVKRFGDRLGDSSGIDIRVACPHDRKFALGVRCHDSFLETEVEVATSRVSHPGDSRSYKNPVNVAWRNRSAVSAPLTLRSPPTPTRELRKSHAHKRSSLTLRVSVLGDGARRMEFRAGTVACVVRDRALKESSEVSMRVGFHGIVLGGLVCFAACARAAEEPTTQALIQRHDKEKSPVWLDGETLTFFYRGNVEQAQVLVGGDVLDLHRLADSDAWTATMKKPDMEKAVVSYAFLPGKKGQDPFASGQRIYPQTWRGPQAPAGPVVCRKLKGTAKTCNLESKALVEKRAVHVYLPPGHDPSRATPVIYGTDGVTEAEVLEPLIVAGKVAPMIVVAPESGGYRGARDPKKPHSLKNDLRAQEYLPGIDTDRFARHEKFFCEELITWAEKEFGASKDRKQRVVTGRSNGARFAVEMGVRHAELFGHVFAFSVAGTKSGKMSPFDPPPRFYLATGTWEKDFYRITTTTAKKLKEQNVPVVFSSRVAGHDPCMWRDEFVKAVQQAFATWY
jgi:enterochelin esterase-like enzyme